MARYLKPKCPKLRRGDVEKFWSLNFVCYAGHLLFASLGLLSIILHPTLCPAGCLLCTICVGSDPLAFACVQSIHNMLKRLQRKRRVRVRYISPVPSLLMVVVGCVPSPNVLTSVR